MNLLAKSCFAPGLICFISNLITTSDEHRTDLSPWVTEYTKGMSHEIYRCRLSVKLENKRFSEVVRTIYKQLKAIVFAIEVKCNKKTIIRLNPSDFVINNVEKNNIYVYCICEDMTQADAIETLDMTKEELNIMYVQKAQYQER